MTGASSHQQRVLLQADFDRFARLSGDDNPIHCDPAFAASSHFGATVAHGMMLYSGLCKVITEHVGPGVVAREQTLMFPEPTYVGDVLTFSVAEVGPADGGLTLATEVSKATPDGGRVATALGHATVVPPMQRWAPLPLPAAAALVGDAELYGLVPGMRAARTRRFTAVDLDEYGDLSGDRNPLFRSDELARARGFAGRIVPWPLLAGLFSDLLGTELPGRGTGWMKQTLRYPAPAYPGETLIATVTITRLRADKELVNLDTRVAAADGRIVCAGEALVLVRNLADKGPKPGFFGDVQ